LPVAIAGCRNIRLEHDSAVANVDDRECMRVAMRVDTNDVVQLICEHPWVRAASLSNSRRSSSAVGIDPEPDMLGEAYSATRELGLENVEWIRGDSTDLQTMAPNLGRFSWRSTWAAREWWQRLPSNELAPGKHLAQFTAECARRSRRRRATR
jgi:hypothetical protein